MTTKEYLNSFNKDFEEIKIQYEETFNEIVKNEKNVSWFAPLEEKLDRLQNPEIENIIRGIIKKIQSDELFDTNDTENLSIYISKINSIVKVADRINNFKEGTKLSEDKTLKLFELFNKIKNCNTIEEFDIELNQNLKSFVPHLFSIIKHCQSPDQFPIHYKFWKNICRKILNINDDYTSLCSLYRSFPLEDRSLLVTSYFGTIAKVIILDLPTNTQINPKEVSHYIRQKNIFNLDGYIKMLDEADRIINSNSPTNYWLYAPGEGAYKWEEFYTDGIMALGWDDLGDLNQYQSKKDINNKLVEVYGGNINKPHDSAANFDFKNTINIGDHIIVKRGRSVLLGYGEVQSEYFFDDEKEDYKHYREVDWIGRGEWAIDESLALKTLTQIRKADYEALLDKMDKNMTINYKEQYRKWLENSRDQESGTTGSYLRAIEILSQKIHIEIFENNNIEYLQSLYTEVLEEQKKPDGKYYHEEAKSYGAGGYYSAAVGDYIRFHQSLQIQIEENTQLKLLKYKKQVILQGPPGTGKTRQAKELAVQLLKLNDAKELKDHTQFKLIQFHPSYTYEDFVRGIVAESKDQNIEYKNVNKILGSFAEEALKNYLDSKKDSETISKENIIQDHFDAFKEFLNDEIEKFDGFYPLTNSIGLISTDDATAFRYRGENNGWLKNGNRMTFKDILQAYSDGNKERQDLKKNNAISGLARQHASYFVRVLNLFQEFIEKNNLKTEVTNESKKIELQNYVLVIDEINRANLSSVLGELIYAMEYRGEAVESMYAVESSINEDKSQLILPPNLYIIGTMNTADRSVGHIDYAIRRRFAFINVLPKDLKDNDNTIHFNSDDFKKVSELFTTENVSSEFEINDVQLGHSYFIAKKEDVKDDNQRNEIFRMKMNYEVVPILLEYVKDGVLIGTYTDKGNNKEWDIKAYINSLKINN